MNFRLWIEGARSVKDLFAKGIDRKDPSILGYHGTSIQTIRALADGGFIPVSKGLKKVFGNHNDAAYGLHVAPNMENKVAKTLEFRRPQTMDPFADAMQFARHVASRHVFFDRYGMNMGRSTHHRAADDMMLGSFAGEKELSPIIKRLRLDPSPKEAVEAGVVLAISDRVAEKFRLLVGGDGNYINIVTNALPVEYVLGIEPQNDAAYEWLDSL
jgi:hypothetical protein